MALGIKIKSVKFSKGYTVETLLEEMKKVTFEAGEPFITKHGFNTMIVFPPIDRQNQVWVMNVKGNKESEKWSIQLSHDIAGDFGNMAKNALLDKVTGGLFGMGSIMGKNAKAGEAAVEEVAKKLEGLGL
ncbi:MAG: hypothetical protein MJ110_05530 [Lachnospiraceae bacterium]|nr:hypothetical protein [Lachnospiraceae bacterium]